MKVTMKAMIAVITFAGFSLSAESAVAGCGPEGMGSFVFKPAVLHEGGSGGLLRTSFGPFNSAAITGLWKFVFTAQGNNGPKAPPKALPIPDGAVVDAGFVTWHDDGTELMNSGRAPASGSFCMGVWKQMGFATYKLNHWALSWIPDYQPGQTKSWSELPGGGVDEAFQAFGPTNIEEVVTLSNHGNGYTGSFRLTQYVNDGSKTPVNDAAGAPVAFVIVGNITASRITP